MLVIDRFPETRLQLLRYTVIVEDGYCTVVQFDNFFFLRGDKSQVILDFFVDTFVVDMDTIV